MFVILNLKKYADTVVLYGPYNFLITPMAITGPSSKVTSMQVPDMQSYDHNRKLPRLGP